MEQTINLFSKGLLLDTNPMVQSNDTLSDALNATFITQNGNEVILLNDMGNRRVDNAFLPPGYEPVGMKEYGGIIYIAAYNPITNKSQIGSFPSPERKISDLDDKTLSCENISYKMVNFPFITKEVLEIYKKEEDIDLSKSRFTTGDSLLFPLTDKISIHAGDKFAVYGELKNTEDLSNYFNISKANDKMVFSPKNKLFSFSLGILNSQNEFVDITKTLVRWEPSNNEYWKIHKFDELTSNLYKFNYGYFIPDTFENLDLSETINDSNFIKERLKIAANTYAYKLVGPLYLKIKLNRFLKFDYIITGFKNNDKDFTLEVEGWFTYNCPDDILIENKQNTKRDNNSNNYYTYELGKINGTQWFTLNNIENYVTSIIDEDHPADITYNSQTDLYTAKIAKKYIINIPQNTNNKYKYYLNVYNNNHTTSLNNEDGFKYFHDGLSVEGIIDIDKLGSGEIEMTGWRFYTTNNSTNIVYNILTYDKYDDRYNEMIVTIIDSETNSIVSSKLVDYYSHHQGINLNWNEYNLQERKLYIVKITLNTTKGSTRDVYGWILTTKLFNDCFNQRINPNTYINDYRNPSSDEEKLTFNDKLDVKFNINLNIEDYSTPIYDLEQKKWISTIKEDFRIVYDHKYHLDLMLYPNLEIINEDYYPNYVKILDKEVSLLESKLEFDGFDKENDIISKKVPGEIFIEYNDSELNINDNTIKGDIITFRDIFKSEAVNDLEINKVFANACGTLENFVKNGNKTTFEYTFKPTYGGVHISGHHELNENRVHVMRLYLTEPTWTNSIDEDDKVEGVYENEIVMKDRTIKECLFEIKEGNSLLKRIQEAFYEFFKSEGILMYMFRYPVEENFMTFYYNIPESVEGMSDDENLKHWISLVKGGNSSLRYNDLNSRVWWRSANDEQWILIEGIFNKNDNITHFLSKQVFGTEDFIYCYRTIVLPSELGIYVPDKLNSPKCNDAYSIEKEFQIKSSSNISNKYKIKNPSDLYNVGIPEFKCNKNLLTSKTSIIIKFNSSLDLNKYFNTYKLNGLNNVYINDDRQNLLLFDVNGDKLDANSIYEMDNNKLVKIKNAPCRVINDSKNLSTDSYYNTLLCSSSEFGMISPNGDLREGNEGNATGLRYSYVPKVGYKFDYQSPRGIYVSGYGFNSDSERVENDSSHVGQRR